jgi:mono/diheme cytochrome c family protein
MDEARRHLEQADLGAIIDYLKTVPRAEATLPERELRPIGRMLVGTGAMEMLFPATYTNHALAFPEMPQVAADASYGEYLAQGCQGCHGEGFVGRTMPGPGSPQAPNLTPAGALGDWTEDGFVAAIRTGVTPDGRVLDAETMPWLSYAKLGDDELRALWIYFSTLEPLE